MPRRVTFRPGLAALLLCLAAAPGCRTPPPPPRAGVFYPPPPEAPRFQYLTSISSPRDVLAPPPPILSFFFGAPRPLPGIVKPYGIALKHGKLYVSDTFNGTIHIADLKRHSWDYFHPDGAGKFQKNIGVAVADDDTLYVSDTMRGQVVIFDPSGKFAGVLGKPEEMKPTAMEIAGDRIYVADLKGHRVVAFDRKTRAPVLTIPQPGVTNAAARLYQPVGLAVDAEGRLFVSDLGAFRIQVYDRAGAYLRTIGRHGDRPGEFVRNKGVALDRAGRLYSADADFQIVQLFDPSDRMLMYFGEPEPPEGRMLLPADVVVDYDNVDLFKPYVAPGREIEFLVLVSNQAGPHKVNVYGFLRPEAAKSP